MADWKEVVRRLRPDWDSSVYDRGTGKDVRNHHAAITKIDAALEADDPEAALAALDEYDI